jgi:hypothetical protein
MDDILNTNNLNTIPPQFTAKKKKAPTDNIQHTRVENVGDNYVRFWKSDAIIIVLKDISLKIKMLYIKLDEKKNC